MLLRVGCSLDVGPQISPIMYKENTKGKVNKTVQFRDWQGMGEIIFPLETKTDTGGKLDKKTSPQRESRQNPSPLFL